MDVVIPVRPGDKNEELRHALRSLVNLPHDRVWIIGHKPPWVDDVGYIPTRQRGTKWVNAQWALTCALRDNRVSDPFILSNDDFYVMHPVEGPPLWHRGSTLDVILEHKRSRLSAYVRAMMTTRSFLIGEGYPDPLSYELHVPTVVDKARMVKALKLGAHITGVHYRTVYGNIHNLGGTKRADVKVYGLNDRIDPGATWLSTSDISWPGTAGQYVAGRFPQPCRYELSVPTQ